MRKIADHYSLFEDDLAHFTDGAVSALEQLRGAHIFITGGTGLFGVWLSECLLYANERHDLGITITVLSRNPERARARLPKLSGHVNWNLVQGDIVDFSFSPVNAVTHIIHLASEGNPDARPDWPLRHLTAAIDGTRRTLDFALSQRVKSCLITTSGSVYLGTDQIRDGRCVEGPQTQADLVSEKAVYGESKRMMEVMAAVWAQAHGFSAPIARCFAFVGPYLALDANYAIGNFIGDVLAERDIVVAGDGTPIRSYLYMADLTVLLVCLLVQGKSGVPCNVGGETAISIGDLAHLVANHSNGKSQVIVRQKPVIEAPVSSYVPDVARTQLLGQKCRIVLDDAISRTLDWHRQR